MRGPATAALIALAAIGLWVAPRPLAADSDSARARAAVEAGEIVTLVRILAKVEALYNGRVLEVELEEENEDEDDDDYERGEREGRGGAIVYEIKLLTPQGNVLRLDVDARTMEILTVKGRGAEKAWER